MRRHLGAARGIGGATGWRAGSVGTGTGWPGIPESFFVEGTEGPLEESGLARAWSWGRSLVNEMSRTPVMI